ncbi:hypothetical protein HSBAA_40160 [Vreelandella sulfidaeris]|uniref:Uncharacterized protein n=1 Tax=Vreelandella sulfidaeris TaxID=115553 RepID=A0A455U944_9GAMM|nr:hypothetical protein HSBAA_40160 [Halomonas sulfidaeris]
MTAIPIDPIHWKRKPGNEPGALDISGLNRVRLTIGKTGSAITMTWQKGLKP